MISPLQPTKEMIQRRLAEVRENVRHKRAMRWKVTVATDICYFVPRVEIVDEKKKGV